MNRQLLESAEVVHPPMVPLEGAEERAISSSTARAIMQCHHTMAHQTMNPSKQQQQAALEATPHVVNALTALWGYYECSVYLRKLMVIDARRESRQGFSQEAFDELVFLCQLIQDNRGSMMKETLPKIQRDELEHRERLRRIESAYLCRR
ncbi:MAG: hypothetical protein ACFCVA_04200 [Gammaproteobacteria bacterium]